LAHAVHDDDAIGVDDGGRAVRGNQGGSIPPQTVEFLRDGVF